VSKNEDVDRSMSLCMQIICGRITQQTDETRGLYHVMISKEDIRNMVAFLDGRVVSFDTLLRPTNPCSDDDADDVIVIFNGVSQLCS